MLEMSQYRLFTLLTEENVLPEFNNTLQKGPTKFASKGRCFGIILKENQKAVQQVIVLTFWTASFNLLLSFK